jgi:tetratricopeptide (TPR) repeat protein
LMPDDSTLLSRAAEMRLAVGETDEAAKLVGRALDVDPRNAAIWRLRGRLRLQSGALRESLADYQRALGYQPDDREALLDVAEIYRRLNEPARALASLQSLSDGYPPGEEPPQVLYLMGLAYGALGRTGDAIESLSAARDRGPSSPELLFRLAEAQWSAGRLAEAQQNASLALSLAPGHVGSLALLKRMRLAGRGEQPTRR